MGKNNRKSNKNWVFYLLLGGFIIKIARFLFKKEKIEDIRYNIVDFVKAEKREVKELKRGQESFSEYCQDSGSIFKEYFIPSASNDHKPKILRTQSLTIIFIFALVLKAAVTGYLFFIYPNVAQMEETISKEVLELTNNDRAINNVGELKLDPVLSAAAFAKAEDMLKNGYFAHYSPDGKKPWDWISRAKYPYLFVGENLAMDFSSAKSAHEALMLSPSHRKNILNGTYKDVGLAVVTGEFNDRKTNILVELFASQKQENLALHPAPDHIAGTSNTSIIQNSNTKVLAAESEKNETAPAVKQPVASVIKNKPTEISSPKPKPAQQAGTSSIETAPVSSPAGNIASGTLPGNTVASALSTSDLMHYGPIAKAEPAQPTEEEVSPNAELINNPPDKIVYIASVNDEKTNFINTVINASQYILLSLVVLLVLSLVVNILIDITIQHKPVIIQTLFLILLLSGLVSSHFHILEQIARQVALI